MTKQVAVEGQIFQFEVVGNDKDKTPIIILHGWGRSGSEWVQLANELENWSKRKIYILDLPGFGGSFLPQVTNIYEYSKLVAKFCEYMELKKVIIIGHSLGGRVGIVLGAKYSNLVEKLILVDPAGVKTRSLKRMLLKWTAKIFVWVPRNWRVKISAKLMDEDYRNNPKLRALYRAIVKDDLKNLLPKIKCLTTVVWGEQDSILPLSLVKVYRHGLSNHIIRVVWGAGHDPHLTHYEQTLRILQEAIE